MPNHSTPLIGMASVGRFDLLRQAKFISHRHSAQSQTGRFFIFDQRPDIEKLCSQGFSISKTVIDTVLRQAAE